MLVSAMRTNESIEMRVVDGRSRDVYPSTIDGDKQTTSNSLLNSNNNNNNSIANTTIQSQRTTAVSGDDFSDINSSISPFDSLNQQKIATSYPNLPGQFKQFDSVTNRALSGSVPALATGITASPNVFHQPKSMSTSSESKLIEIIIQFNFLLTIYRRFNNEIIGYFYTRCSCCSSLSNSKISNITLLWFLLMW